MSCLDDNAAAAFVQGLMGPVDARAAEAHLESCVQCRTLMIDFAQAFSTPSVNDDTDVSTPAESPPIRRGDRLDRYVVLDCVGTGGMSTVYSAYDPELDRKVALKVMRVASEEASVGDPHREERLLVEARAIARLSHPNVVSVFDARLLQGELFIAMELVDGQTLRQRLDSHPDDWEGALQLCIAAGRGLAAAHRAGIVHRDFKPDNVLVGQDQRARVADFGLATQLNPADGDTTPALAMPADAPLEPPRTWPQGLTRTGYVLGTPLYMSPEQMVNLAPSVASDQYALCLVTWEAVFGAQPFSAHSFEELLEVRGRSDLSQCKRRPGIPGHIEAALVRGLRAKPEDRWPSVDALLDALAPRRPRTSAWMGLGAVAAVAVMGAGLSMRWSQSPPCDQGAAMVARTFDPSTRTQLDAHLGEATGARLGEGLQQWAEHWAAAHDLACRDTRVDGVHSTPVLDRRMACLERRRDEMATLIEVTLDGPAPDAGKSLEVLPSIADLRACTDVERLLHADAPPSDPNLAAAVDDAMRMAGRARVHRETGRYDDAQELARQALDAAAATEHAPALAFAQLELGRALAASGDPAGARTTLAEAVSTATAAGADQLTAKAWVALVGAEAATTPPGPDARRLEGFARAAVRRVGDPAALRLRWLIAAGALARGEGRLPDARARLQDARALVIEQDDPVHHADVLRRLAHVEIDSGDPEAALGLIEQALALRQDVLGDDHPRVADVMQNYANVLLGAGRFEDAEQLLQQALEIAERSLGPEHPNLAGILGTLSVADRRLGRTDDARRHLGRALKIRESALGPEHVDTAGLRVSLANIDYAEDRYPAAHEQLERALSIYAQTLPDDHPQVISARANLASVQTDMGRLDEAEAGYLAVIEAREAALGPDHPDVAIAQANLGQVLTAAGQPGRAIVQLDRALRTARARMGPEHPFVAFAEHARQQAELAAQGEQP